MINVLHESQVLGKTPKANNGLIGHDTAALEGLSQLMEEKEVTTFEGKEGNAGGKENDRFCGVPHDWYKGPTNDMNHVREQDMTPIDIADVGEEPRLMKVGAQLTFDGKMLYRDLLREFKDVFAWSYEDLNGISPTITMYEIPLTPEAIPKR